MKKIIFLFIFLALSFPAEFHHYELIKIGPAVLRIFDVFTIFSLIFVSVYSLMRRNPKIEKTGSLFTLITIYFLWGIIVGVIGGGVRYGFRAFGEARINTWYVLIFYVTINLINSREDIKKLVQLIFVTQIFVMIFSVLKSMFWGYGDINSRLLNSTEAIHLYITMMGVFLIISAKVYKKTKLNIFVFACIVLIVISGQKTTWLILPLGFLYYILKENKIKSFIKYIPVLLIVIFSVYGLITNIGLLKNALEFQYSLLAKGEEGESVAWRILMWENAIEKVKANPITGEGYGGYNEDVIINNQLNADPIHSAYFDKMAKIGIPGLISFLLVVIVFLKDSKRILQTSDDLYNRTIIKACNISILSYLVFFITYGETFLFWIIIGIGYSLKKIDINNSSRDKVASMPNLASSMNSN